MKFLRKIQVILVLASCGIARASGNESEKILLESVDGRKIDVELVRLAENGLVVRKLNPPGFLTIKFSSIAPKSLAEARIKLMCRKVPDKFSDIVKWDVEGVDEIETYPRRTFIVWAEQRKDDLTSIYLIVRLREKARTFEKDPAMSIDGKGFELSTPFQAVEFAHGNDPAIKIKFKPAEAKILGNAASVVVRLEGYELDLSDETKQIIAAMGLFFESPM
jgi:hypothetical protein